MTARFYDCVDWSRPWLAELLPAAMPVLGATDWRQEINVAAGRIGLCNHRGLPIRFVEQSELPPGTPYEAYISATGKVPTRENLHDFFNALVWLSYPRVKAQLNALQAIQIASANIAAGRLSANTAAVRGKLRDAATIFDENAALLISCDAELIDSLREHRWHRAFVTRKAAFETTCEVRLFGHALVEKLVLPYKAITAHAWVLEVDEDFFALTLEGRRRRVDSMIVSQITHGMVSTDFTPLPVLGVPGWWSGQDQNFYDDAKVFRPKRVNKSV